MYHHEMMRAIADERVRVRRTEARGVRDARLARRAREYWAERAERIAARSARRPRRHGAAPAR
ncbi:hypothetical protein E1293_44630 [Actinomadura darangshiensis]|uniref:Uncharacterized protein n=1 Tax=Actinomadura darangshiensis TaxID=705336 RepID=A0A4R4ZU03_9ACTN|nr:hypothetical protein [Actinomadura darangshiensis]TDD61826.1 hypothetical protein E1293_44630 [Actinomadura darangshiensis]